MKLPVVSSTKAIKALDKLGYYVHHQTGSHIILKKNSPPPNRLVVPKHRELKKGTLRGIIKDAGLEVEDFIKLLK